MGLEGGEGSGSDIMTKDLGFVDLVIDSILQIKVHSIDFDGGNG